MNVSFSQAVDVHTARAVITFAKNVTEKHPKNALKPEVYIVGGAVRDIILGQTPHDIDIEVFNVSAVRLQKLIHAFFKNIFIQAIPAFGVWKLNTKPTPISISLPRTDEEQPTSHAHVVATPNPHLTKQRSVNRRDFTCNALLLNPLTGIIFDYVDGVRDIQDKRLRAVNTGSIAHDPQRAWRAIQFLGRLNFVLDRATSSAFQKQSSLAPKLSGPRVREEIEKLFCYSQNPSRALQVAKRWGIIAKDLPELAPLLTIAATARWNALCSIIANAKTAEDRWMHLINAAGPLAQPLANRLQFSKLFRNRLKEQQQSRERHYKR